MRWEIEAGGGRVPVLADESDAETIVVLAHGAGSHMEHRTVESVAGVVRDAGARPVRFNFLYRAEGRPAPDRMPKLIETYRGVIASVRERLRAVRLVIGGHSMGGRVASMLEAERSESDGLMLFGYPLHPAGQPEKLRTAHLGEIHVRTLCVNGDEDALCTRSLMEATLAELDPRLWTMHWVRGADHSYAVKKSSGRSRDDVLAEMREVASDWLRR